MEILDSSENTVGEYFGLEVNKNQNLVSFSNGIDAKKMDKMKTEYVSFLCFMSSLHAQAVILKKK
jgi:hypothetical protein